MAPDPLEMEIIKTVPVATVPVNLNTWEVEAGGSKVQGHPRLCLVWGSLSYTRPCPHSSNRKDLPALELFVPAGDPSARCTVVF